MKIFFEKTTDELYPNELPFEDVYCIRNEREAFVGLIYLSELPDGNIYVDWIEILVVQRGRGYLREIFKTLAEMFPSKEIHFECEEKLKKKYLHIGCEELGISDLTGNYKMVYKR